MATQTFEEFLCEMFYKNEKMFIKEGCAIETTCAKEIEKILSVEAYLWERNAFWPVRQGDAKGELTLAILERDPMHPIIINKPGYNGRHCLYGEFSFETNPYLSRRNWTSKKDGNKYFHYRFGDEEIEDVLQSMNGDGLKIGLQRVLSAWAFIEHPGMIMDPKAFLEIHTYVSKEYNQVVFRAFHPEDVSIREENILKARELAEGWGLPALRDDMEINPNIETTLRNYHSSLVVEEYSTISANENLKCDVK